MPNGFYIKTYIQVFLVFVRYLLPHTLLALHQSMVEATDEVKHRVEILHLLAPLCLDEQWEVQSAVLRGGKEEEKTGNGRREREEEMWR